MKKQMDTIDKGQRLNGAKPKANNDPLKTAYKYLIFIAIYIRFCRSTEKGLF